jgi:hypothetical protein
VAPLPPISAAETAFLAGDDDHQDLYIIQMPRSRFFPLPVSQEPRMSAWKVLFILVFGLVCLGLTLATLIVPWSVVESGYRWLWFGGLLFATVCMGTLFTLYLQSADRAFNRHSHR